MSVAFIFPGQGSQAVGMGAELAKAYPSARAVFEEVDAALSQNLSRVMWEGPEAELTLTENAQPALMAVSLAAMRVLNKKGLDLPRKAAFVAGQPADGHTLLVGASGAMTIAAAVTKAMPFDTLRDFSPVTLVASFPTPPPASR